MVLFFVDIDNLPNIIHAANLLDENKVDISFSEMGNEGEAPLRKGNFIRY